MAEKATAGRGKNRKPKRQQRPPLRQITTAIMVDGGFYRRRASTLFGKKSPEARADELQIYCRRHIQEARSSLYRIFYYDCPPSEKVVFHPFTEEQVNLAKSDQFEWMIDFLRALTKKRKVALRRGEELSTPGQYLLTGKALKRVCRKEIDFFDLTERDFKLDIVQKGVDMRIGLDIAAMAERGLVNQIIMITGDSDFVPAAKHARRSGIDFILDPLWAPISDSLNEHIDGIQECVRKPPENQKDPLHVDYVKDESERDEDDDFL